MKYRTDKKYYSNLSTNPYSAGSGIYDLDDKEIHSYNQFSKLRKVLLL